MGNTREGAEPPLRFHARLFAVVFLLSVVMLSVEVIATRLLAYRFFYHYVFLIVSLAQLGLAGAGAWVYALEMRQFGSRYFQRAVLGLGALTLLFLAAYLWLSPAANTSTAKITGQTVRAYLLVLSVVLVGLYFSAGLVYTGLFTQYKERFARLYAVDLLGGAAGCAASLGAMWLVGPINALLLSAVVIALASFLVPPPGQTRQGIKRTSIATAGIAALCMTFALTPGLRDAGAAGRWPPLDFEWTHLARTDRFGPSAYVIDGDAATYLKTDPDAPAGMASADIEFGLVKPEPDVAIIGVGAGPQLWEALAHGAGSVLAIDINPTILRWAMGKDSEANKGIFLRPEVTVKIDEGRHALRSTDKRFDLILMHAIDTYTASSMGAYSLSENHLYTVEAFQSFWHKLQPQGVMVTRRWLFYPPRENLRLFITIHEALEGVGVADPSRHLVAIAPTKNYRDPDLKEWGIVLFSRAPFSRQQLAYLDGEIMRRGWSYLFRPGARLDTPFASFASTGGSASFYESYPYNVRPCYDANPFFFQNASLRSEIARLFDKGTARSWGFSSSVSTSTLFITLVILVALTGVMLVLPVVIRRKRMLTNRPRPSRTLYFAALGVGFMAVELASIQAMTLFLGHPTYALSIVLLGTLTFAGVGSLVVQRVRAERIREVCLAVGVASVAAAFLLYPLIHEFLAASFGVRVAITLVYLGMLCTLMGMPMAGGIRLIGDEDRTQVAWAWLCNSGCAVIGSTVCMFLMIYRGVPTLLVLAGICYLLAALASARMLRTTEVR